ncbi:MAG: putative transcriptional regulator, ArsR family [Frankiales bacterium]|nr:putative transcriptional regulator, ArsR family [Frankiales bacterium]
MTALAAPLPMSLPAVMQHLRTLEDCGVVRSEKVGRVRTCHLDPAALQLTIDWTADRKNAWENRLDRLEAYLQDTEPIADREVPASAVPASAVPASKLPASKRRKR